MEQIKKQVFLNKRYLVKWTEKKTAFAVQSPVNPKAVIWWSREWFQISKKWPCGSENTCLGVGENNPGHIYCPTGYFATACVFNRDYEQIVYGEKGVEEIISINGKKLFEAFEEMKRNNSKQYLQQAMQLQNALANKSDTYLNIGRFN
ncbi:hypothetical protein [Spiroplasma chrysopicola]|uniref:Uncharacterized protein n=1 Tax=Spiroplasma chrysopicola DF-1 TaxID=1276227 RepID=R4UH60_9MOLU|nr:hypothetical protein [Spiroplasma chrysopicola]AGM25515.1 hypothetical protein SCHRY_v1c09430 [Spiroplasma chrysopicola DF-1]